MRLQYLLFFISFSVYASNNEKRAIPADINSACRSLTYWSHIEQREKEKALAELCKFIQQNCSQTEQTRFFFDFALTMVSGLKTPSNQTALSHETSKKVQKALDDLPTSICKEPRVKLSNIQIQDIVNVKLILDRLLAIQEVLYEGQQAPVHLAHVQSKSPSTSTTASSSATVTTLVAASSTNTLSTDEHKQEEPDSSAPLTSLAAMSKASASIPEEPPYGEEN